MEQIKEYIAEGMSSAGEVARRTEDKQIMKEALKEWLDEKLAQFGWFSLKTIAVMGLGALAYFVLLMNGWHR